MNDDRKGLIKRILSYFGGCFGLLVFFILPFYADQMTFGIASALLSLPMVLIGLVLWGCYRKSNKPLALGFLTGGLLPFSIVFVLTNGCGIFI